MQDPKPSVLFLCTGNCCRSPMGEGLLRMIAGDRYEALSAGVSPAGFVHELAEEAMLELGADITTQRSKHILEFLPPRGTPPRLIISLCSYADAECPQFPPEVRRLRWPCADPIAAGGSRENRLREFRRVRDLLRRRIEEALESGELDRVL